MARHWWQILMLWAVGTGAAMVVIQTQVTPKYRVTGVLRVLPVNDRLFGGGQGPRPWSCTWTPRSGC